jgi:hypothetical protein
MRGFRIERAVTEERIWALVALLLEALRAHGPEEAVRSQRDMRSARSGCRPAWRSQTARHADAALETGAGSAALILRPSVLAA